MRNENQPKVTVVVGGQYGSEGKGKVVADLVHRSEAQTLFVVRCGGPNSGHSVVVDGKLHILKALPSGVCAFNAEGNPSHKRSIVFLVIPAGAVVNVDLLKAECELMKISWANILVDERAVVMLQTDGEHEATNIKNAIGSTASGNGNALIRRMARFSGTALMGDLRDAKFGLHENIITICNTGRLLNSRLRLARRGEVEVIVEGNQGFGLSLLHGTQYPFLTSRDTTAAGFCSEIGLSPFAVTDIVMVMRTYPIRVGGNSGPMFEETTWEVIAGMGGWPKSLQQDCAEMKLRYDPDPQEWTSVTKKLRRVGMPDWNLVRLAALYNQPTAIAVMGVDRLSWKDRDITCLSAGLSKISEDYIAKVAHTCLANVRWIGTGPTSMISLSMKEKRT